MYVSHTAHHAEEWRECSKKWSQHGIHSCHSKRWITFQKQSGPPLATQALAPGEGLERLQGQVTTNIFCSSALLHHSFLFFVFFDMRKPDIGSTDLISWGIWSTGPLACSLCWLFCHRFLHDWFPWQQRRCRPKQKTSWQCLWAETHEAEHLAKRCSQSNSNETQWDSMTSTLLPVELLNFADFAGSFAHDVTTKSFFCQPHQFPAVLELYRTEGPRLDAASSGATQPIIRTGKICTQKWSLPWNQTLFKFQKNWLIRRINKTLYIYI